ncbi:MAG: hypothetical protein P9F75_14675 [Candidatus Contendobacter sp.]|nr:hypothetical protein [Candidatus Contendobacter sp.]
MKTVAVIALVTLGLNVAVLSATHAAGRFHAGGTVVNEQGAVSGRGAAVRGPHGGGAARGGGAAVDNQGNFVSGHEGAATIKDSSGNIKAQGVRAGKTTGKVGSGAQHQSGMAAQGTQGTVKSTGSFSTDGAGGASGSRSTSAQSSTTDASYQGSTSYQKGSGATHTSTCTNAAGQTVSCTK